MTHLFQISAPAWMLLSVLLFSVNFALTKGIDTEVSSSQIIFLRSVTSLICLALIFRPMKFVKGFQTQSLSVHVLRGLFGAGYLYLAVISLRELPLSVSCSLFEVAPFFILIFSSLFLGERLKRSTMLICMLAFSGVMLILNPSGEGSWIYICAAIMAAACHAMTVILAKKATDQDKHITTILYYITASAIISSVGVGNLSALSIKTFGLISVMGVIHIGAFCAYLQALKQSALDQIALLEFVGIVFAFGFDSLFFYGGVNVYQVSGIALIVLSNVLMHNGMRRKLMTLVKV